VIHATVVTKKLLLWSLKILLDSDAQLHKFLPKIT
jgi:hypothetical protein